MQQATHAVMKWQFGCNSDGLVVIELACYAQSYLTTAPLHAATYYSGHHRPEQRSVACAYASACEIVN
jgi:hypothetical protein